ncbi:DUF5809 family protein [Halocatena pleomorpha]|uniref:Uncharacterized protein n=1 Tax=Halocatena pleomorpha TaxID=1785090 RepID=A0A3P3R6Z6_9EURY|nr:DUF5809 family protein [Halocatena pleomorpha]RRJ29164.1 hypothetical protein EIK79_13575 [Halocatena pleomorpha]
MHSEGLFAPSTAADVRQQYEELGSASQTVVREVAKSMAFDREEYDERVTTSVVTTARDALFASLLEVTVGTREEFDDWCAKREYEIELAGSESVDHVVWHPVTFAETVVGATFQSEEAAAIGTLRRQAFGRHYRELLKNDA